MTSLLLMIGIVVAVTAAYLAFRGRGGGPELAETLTFAPDAENDKVVLVQGWSEAEIGKIVSDFTETYKNAGFSPFTIEPHKEFEHLYRLTFPEDIHPQLFNFLVNYLAYPFDFELTNRSIIIGGKSTLTFGFEEIDPQLVGKKAIFYVPENDQERTVVYVQTESGVTLANSFTDLKWRKVNDARLSKEVKNPIAGV
jgi:hypothetical protein